VKAIKKHIRFESLKQSDMDVVITAVNVRTSRIAYFGKDVIDEERLLASAAMPLLCSWRIIDGEPYWDGAVMDNVPILPALKYGADEIVAVLLSPVGTFEQRLPRSILEASELMFEQSLAGAFHTLLSDRAWPDSISGAFHSPAPSGLHMIDGKTKLAVVAPTRMLGFKSLYDFSKKQTRQLLRDGYEAARTQLSSFLGQP
jgi:NTE family protein